MSKKPPSEHAHKIIAIGLYIVLSVLVIAPLSFVDPHMTWVPSPARPDQDYFLFNESMYFQPFIELLFLSIGSILVGLIVIGSLKAKIRGIIALVLLIGIYLPFSFVVYLLPSFFDFISDLIQIGFRRIICERHHTGIVATNKGYLYDCPLGIYTWIFVIIKNIFVVLNLVILSATSGFVFVYLTRMFQDNEEYLNFQKYIDFCLSVFIGSVPLITVMFLGHLFDLYGFVIYQVFVVLSIIISFLPIINFTCNEMNPYGVVSLSIKKISAIIGIGFFAATVVGTIALIVGVFGQYELLDNIMFGPLSFLIIFASYNLFCIVMIVMMTTSYTQSSVSMADVSGVIAVSLVFGILLSVLFLDASSRVQFIWHVQDDMISRNVERACLLGEEAMDCPYILP